MFSKDVTRTDKQYRKPVQPGRDKKVFSGTADLTHKVNTISSSAVKRGGIRL